jgi:ABC-type multidrug transport system fused ATPase/permease subunit
MLRQKSQIKLYQLAEVRKREVKKIDITKNHLSFFYRFIKNNKKLFIIFLYLIIAQIALELFLAFFTRFYLNRLSFNLEKELLISMLVVLFMLIIIYLIISYHSIKIEKKILVYIANSLREKWYNIYINKNDQQIKQGRKASLLAKITYHFPLLQMGLKNSAINIFKWFFYLIALLILGFIVSSKLLLIIILSIPILLLIIFIAYKISRLYVSKETTLYSEIIKHIVNSLYNLSFIQKNNIKKEANDKLGNLVFLDTYYRIKRELLILFGNRVIFALIILFIGIYYLLQIHSPALILFLGTTELVMYAIAFLYLSRLFYLSLKIGLFIYPLRLGVNLSVPEHGSNSVQKDNKNEVKSLVFSSPKTKLFKEASYLKQVKIELNENNRVLIYGSHYSGKTKLASLIAGQEVFNKHSWIVHFNKQRMTYSQYQKISPSTYFIQPNFYSENTLLEIIIGNYKENFTQNEINECINTFINEECFNYILSLQKSFNTSFNQLNMSPVQSFIIQAMHCYLKQPPIVIIDNLWLDLNYPEINKILNLLDQKLKQSSIIHLARNNNEQYVYQKKYQILKNKIQAI